MCARRERAEPGRYSSTGLSISTTRSGGIWKNIVAACRRESEAGLQKVMDALALFRRD